MNFIFSIYYMVSYGCFIILTAEWSSWLPLYGNLCCRLVAQPACMTQTMMIGYLSQKVCSLLFFNDSNKLHH